MSVSENQSVTGFYFLFIYSSQLCLLMDSFPVCICCPDPVLCVSHFCFTPLKNSVSLQFIFLYSSYYLDHTFLAFNLCSGLEGTPCFYISTGSSLKVFQKYSWIFVVLISKVVDKNIDLFYVYSFYFLF